MALSLRGFWVNIMERYLPMMVERNYSLQGALNWLGSMRADFSEKRFVTAYRNAAKQLWAQPLVAKIPLTEKVPAELRTSREFQKDRRYMYHVKIRTVDEATGKVTMRSRAFYSNRDLTVGAALKQAEKNWRWKYENYGYAATNYTFDYLEENERAF